jgi:hypothetical protein
MQALPAEESNTMTDGQIVATGFAILVLLALYVARGKA